MKLADQATESLTAKLNGLPERGRVAATTDLWTDKYKNNSYLDLTVFFVDDSDELHHQIVRCGLFTEERKTAANIRAVLVQWFNEIGISENVILHRNCYLLQRIWERILLRPLKMQNEWIALIIE